MEWGNNSNMNSSKSDHITASFKAFQWLQSLRAGVRDPWGIWWLTAWSPILSPGCASGTPAFALADLPTGECSSLTHITMVHSFTSFKFCSNTNFSVVYYYEHSIENSDPLEFPTSSTLSLFSHSCFHHLIFLSPLDMFPHPLECKLSDFCLFFFSLMFLQCLE